MFAAALSANPVDLDQPEGRVHRSRGHAVRNNLAAADSGDVLANGDWDPGNVILEAAADGRGPIVNDIVPFWICPGDAQTKRHVPACLLSREVARLADLRRSLAFYRLVSGEPRQEELAA